MPVISQTYPRLTAYSEENFQGRTGIYRGNLGIANLDSRIGGIESLRFYSTNSNATLVLFSRTGFRGAYRIYRSNVGLRDLEDLVSGEDAESLISTNANLTNAQIQAIRSSGRLPSGYRRL
ncbi:hypothetical protein [Cohnella sp. GCM10027633]|uniref:hypothetical protein n=1 Tax=unclassified Cohnella TaxID=2636738 RepID=UPI0036366031